MATIEDSGSDVLLGPKRPEKKIVFMYVHSKRGCTQLKHGDLLWQDQEVIVKSGIVDW